ncbi:hypothetical protein D3C80_1526440 [compost metagenome]
MAVVGSDCIGTGVGGPLFSARDAVTALRNVYLRTCRAVRDFGSVTAWCIGAEVAATLCGDLAVDLQCLGRPAVSLETHDDPAASIAV